MRRESLNVKVSEEEHSAVLRFTFHVLPFTVFEGDFFSILLRFGFAVIQMPMLPVEPGMAKFVGKNVAPSGHG